MRRALFATACCISMLCALRAESFNIKDLETLKARSADARTIETLSPHTAIQAGWNLFRTPKTGIQIQKTFGSYSDIKLFAVEPITGKWAFFSADTASEHPQMLLLEALEPDTVFYLRSTQKRVIKDIAVTVLTSKCLELSKDKEGYTVLIDSGLDDAAYSDENRSISFKSRQKSLFDQDRYGDTRLALLIPNIELKSKQIRKYGPAEPKSHIIFNKAYENQPFYIFSFRDQTCYEGIFPSKDRPPFAILNRVKP